MAASFARQIDLNARVLPAPMGFVSRFVKRALDVIVSTTLLVLAAPIIAVLGVLVRIHDGGPSFYRRRVIGPRGAFDAFKLRTMRIGADEILRRDPVMRQRFQVSFKLRDDPRVTSVGAFLRKNSLDELPQLWNVLKGEMSLVGPRMITAAELEKYGDAAWIFRSVKPGLTGYWQVVARQEVSYEERVAMDLFYLKNWSLLLDLKILLKTPARVLRRTGAY